MKYYSLIIPRENAYEVLDTLAYFGLTELVDQHNSDNAQNRLFNNHLKKIEELEHKLALVEQEILKRKKPIFPPEDTKYFYEELRNILRTRNLPDSTFLSEIETEIDSKSHKITESIKS